MRIHSVFTEAVELIHAEDYPALSAKDGHDSDEDCEEGVDYKTGVAALLAVCRRQNFNAFVPIITTKCFLRPSTLDLFIQSPTYHFATSLLLHFPDSDLMAEKPRSYAEEKFVEFSKPLRFLKNVRFSITIYDNFDVSSLVENHVLPLLFLEHADIINLLPRLYVGLNCPLVPVWKIHERFHQMLIDRNEVLPFFHLLKHKRERVRSDAAYQLALALHEMSDDREILFFSQNKLIVEFGALELLFRLMDGKVSDETSWCSYMKAAGSICCDNDAVDFDRQILPHLHLIKNFLDAKSSDVALCAACLLRFLLEGKVDTLAPKFVEHGFVATLVNVIARDDNLAQFIWEQATLVLLLISNNESCRGALVQPRLPSGEICFFAVAGKRLGLPLQYRNKTLRALMCKTLNNLFPIVDENEINIDLFIGVVHANQQDSEGHEHRLEIARCLSTCLKRRKKIFADDRAFFNFVSENRSGFLKTASIATSFFRADHDESGRPGINERERNASSEIVDAIAEVIEYEFFQYQCCNLKMKLITMKTNGDENYKTVEKGIELFEAFADCSVDDAVYVMEINRLADRAKSAVNQADDVHYHLDRLKQFFVDKCINEDAQSDEQGVPMPQELTRSIQDLAEARSILRRINMDTVCREAEETKQKIMERRVAEMASDEHTDIDEIVLQVAKHFDKGHRLQDGQLKRLPSCPIFEEVDLFTLAQIEQVIRNYGNTVKYTYRGPLNTVYRKCRGFYIRTIFCTLRADTQVYHAVH